MSWHPHTVLVPMRDLVGLATDVHLPDGPDADALTFLLRTPYGRRGSFDAVPELAELLTGLGHVLVVQDVRGKFDSEGRCRPFSQERNDAADTLDWIERQEWSTGRVVPTGESYCGFTALTAAASRHPSVVAVLAGMTTTLVVTDWLNCGGIFRLQLNAEWITMSFGGQGLPAELPWTIDNWWDIDDVEMLDTGDARLAALRELRRASVSADGDVELAGGLDARAGAVAEVPLVLWTGFWDPLARGTIAEFRAAQTARPDQRHHLEIASADHLGNSWDSAVRGQSQQRDRAAAVVTCYRRNLPHLRAALVEAGEPSREAVDWEDQDHTSYRDVQWPPASGEAYVAAFAGEVSVPAPGPFPALPDSGETFVWGSLAADYPDERATAAREDVVALSFDADAIVGDLVVCADAVWGDASRLIVTLAQEQPDGRLLRVAEGALSRSAAESPGSCADDDDGGTPIRVDLGPLCHHGAPRAGLAPDPPLGTDAAPMRWWLLLSQELYPRYLPATQSHAWLADSAAGRAGARPPSPVLLRGLSVRGGRSDPLSPDPHRQ